MASAVLEAFQYELEEEYVRGPAAPQEAIESWFILYYNQALLVGTLNEIRTTAPSPSSSAATMVVDASLDVSSFECCEVFSDESYR